MFAPLIVASSYSCLHTWHLPSQSLPRLPPAEIRPLTHSRRRYRGWRCQFFTSYEAGRRISSLYSSTSWIQVLVIRNSTAMVHTNHLLLNIEFSSDFTSSGSNLSIRVEINSCKDSKLLVTLTGPLLLYLLWMKFCRLWLVYRSSFDHVHHTYEWLCFCTHPL